MTVLDDLAARVVALRPGCRVRVAVDGVDCAGKTTLADQLDARLAGTRPVVRASVDCFHRPRAQRYRRGRLSPLGCYRDTFDLPALRGQLLEPFAQAAPFVTAVFDHRADAPRPGPAQDAAPDAVLLVDGVFLLRPELQDAWDLAIHLRVPDGEVLRRAALRDGPQADALYRARYLPAQRLYASEARPDERAQVVLDNRDPQAPAVLRWVGDGAG